MDFSLIAGIFDKMEKTSKRLELTDDLANLFRQADKSEVRRLAYLCQGMVSPQFTGIELGVGDKLAQHAISVVSGKSTKEIEASYRKTGDLGDTAAVLLQEKQQTLLSRHSLSAEKVYDNFSKIAVSSGSGSQDAKVKLLAELLANAEPSEAKSIVRFAQGRLRIGASDATILDAFSVIAKGDKSLRPVLERAYNLRSDLGLVAEMFFDGRLAEIEALSPEPFSPIRPALAERLPDAAQIIEKLGECSVEGKYDGLRCISGYTSIYVLGKGIVSARYVKIGDSVLTHEGKFKKVLATSRRVIGRKERLFRFQTFLGNEFKISEGHEVYALRQGKIQWVPVEGISPGDEVVFPIPRFAVETKPPRELLFEDKAGYTKRVKFDNQMFRFLGYWIGDGYTNEFHSTERVGIIFNSKDKRLKNRYKRIVGASLHIKSISENLHNGASYLYWRDPPFKDWLSKYFRREWKGKMIPQWFANLSKGHFKQFLQGWIEADGHVDESGRTSIVTKEADLAGFVQLIALRHGIIIGVRRFRVNRGTYYKLTVTKNQRRARISGGKIFVKVLRSEELKRRDPRTILWNFQVEGDESYCTTMVALHNCQIHAKGGKVEIYSRKQEPLTHMFPEIVAAVLKDAPKRELIFEGEAIALDEKTGSFLPFQVTIQRRRKHGVAAKARELPLRLFAFELLFLDGKDYTLEPYRERRRQILELFKGEVISPAEAVIVKTEKELTDYFEDSVARGLEGIIAKDLKAPYIAGARKFAWIKLKKSYGSLVDTFDLVVIGYYFGKGKRTEFEFGGLLAAVYDDKSGSYKGIARIGTGFSEEMMASLEKTLSKLVVSERPANVDSGVAPDKWVEPKLVVEVSADEISRSPSHSAGKSSPTDSGLALRFPRLISVRIDKGPKQATTEEEVMEMYEQQRQR